MDERGAVKDGERRRLQLREGRNGGLQEPVREETQGREEQQHQREGLQRETQRQQYHQDDVPPTPTIEAGTRPVRNHHTAQTAISNGGEESKERPRSWWPLPPWQLVGRESLTGQGGDEIDGPGMKTRYSAWWQSMAGA